MKFTKMQGAGNDFLILDNRDGQVSPADYPRLASVLCKRRLSIGADGLMIIGSPEAGGDFRMSFFNSDGSEGEMCGNGARCIARYGFEKGLAGKTIRIETSSGLVTGERINRFSYRIRLNSPTILIPDIPITIGQTTYECAYAELGSPGLPHAVVRIPGLVPGENDRLREIGRSIRFWHQFPKGANVNFYDLLPDKTVNVLTFERGVEDFTLACGTGCGCTAAVLAIKGLLPSDCITLRVPGGTLQAEIILNHKKPEQTSDNAAPAIRDLFLTGPAVWVAEGEIGEDLLL